MHFDARPITQHFMHLCLSNFLELRAVRPRTAVKPSGPQREHSSTSDGVAGRKKTQTLGVTLGDVWT